MKHLRFFVWVFLVWAAAFLAGSNGFAATILQTQGATLLDVGNSFIVPVEFNEFNTALGSLTSITLSLQASFSGTVGVENLSNAPDVAAGIIAGSVMVADNGGAFVAEVFPVAAGPSHDFTPFDGTLDYAGTSGATDSVNGAPVSTSVTAPPPAPVLSEFSGTGSIFLSLAASTFPIVQGMETESVTETANAHATVQLTYTYTPASAVPEPATMAMLAAAACAAAPWVRRRLICRPPSHAPRHMGISLQRR